jgi:CRP/FNR family transcriptional regulator, cyclic AMP receptor protein
MRSERHVLNVERNATQFSKPSIEALQEIMTDKDYCQGSSIYIEGDKNDLFYYVKEGTVKLTKTSDDGTDLAMYYYFPGDFFGDLEPKAIGKCVFTAIAHTRVKLGVIHQSELEWQLYQNGELAVDYAKWQSTMQHYTQYKLRDLVFHGKNGALASILIRMANTYGIKDDNDGYFISRKFTNTEVASLIGATRETVNRMLAKFKADGLIDYDRGRIQLLNMEELRKICHCEGCPMSICRL